MSEAWIWWVFHGLACQRPYVYKPRHSDIRIGPLTCHRLHRWVSIKVVVADSTKASRELQNIHLITEGTKNKQGSQYISKLLETFVHHGPNGAHQCLVLEFLGPTLATVLTNYNDSHRHLPYETVLRLSRQFLQAIALIHQAGCGHGGMFPTTLLCLLSRSIGSSSTFLCGSLSLTMSRFEHQQCSLFLSQIIQHDRRRAP
jgi:serine/threonine protein kinase